MSDGDLWGTATTVNTADGEFIVRTRELSIPHGPDRSKHYETAVKHPRGHDLHDRYESKADAEQGHERTVRLLYNGEYTWEAVQHCLSLENTDGETLSADHLRAAADSLDDARTDLTRAVKRGPDDAESQALIDEHDEMVSQLQNTLRELAINVGVLEEADEQ